MLAHPGAFGDVELRFLFPLFAANQGHQTPAFHGQVVLNTHQIQQGGGHVLQLAVVGIALALRQMALPADDQRHHQGAVVHAVMVKVAVVIVQGLTMVGGEDHHGVLFQTQGFQLGQDLLDAVVHVSHGGVILGDDVVRVGAALGNPALDVVAEGLEVVDLLHPLVFRIKGIALEEHILERNGRQVGGVGIHVPQEQHEGLVLSSQTLQLGDGNLVQVLGLVGTAVIMVGTPAGEGNVIVVATAGGIALEADAGGGVAQIPENLSQHGNAVHNILLAQANHIGAEAVTAGHHVGVTGGGGNVGGEAVFKGDTAFGVLGNVGGSQTAVAVVTHMVPAEAVNAEKQQIGKFLTHNNLL